MVATSIPIAQGILGDDAVVKEKSNSQAMVKSVKPFLDRREGAEDHWLLLEEEERQVVGMMIYYRGNLDRVAKELRWSLEQVHQMLDPDKRPAVWRAIDFYYNNVRDFKRDLNSERVLRYLLVESGTLMTGEETPPETKRKIGRDMMEAEGWFPKTGLPNAAPNIAIQVNIPDWKQDDDNPS